MFQQLHQILLIPFLLLLLNGHGDLKYITAFIIAGILILVIIIGIVIIIIKKNQKVNASLPLLEDILKK
jgi:hypothetical protein